MLSLRILHSRPGGVPSNTSTIIIVVWYYYTQQHNIPTPTIILVVVYTSGDIFIKAWINIKQSITIMALF